LADEVDNRGLAARAAYSASTASPTSGGDDAVEHTHPAPADQVVVERLVRGVAGWRVAPLQTLADDMDDAADVTAIVQPWHAAREREVRPDPPHLGRDEQERRLSHASTAALSGITPAKPEQAVDGA
jgi:hypothetical protein